MLFVAGLTDDYVMDGRVITQLFNGNGGLKQTEALGACYKQLNGSVGQFGTSTLVASTAALASGSNSDDTKYADIDGKLSTLGSQRDACRPQTSRQRWIRWSSTARSSTTARSASSWPAATACWRVLLELAASAKA